MVTEFRLLKEKQKSQTEKIITLPLYLNIYERFSKNTI